MSQVSDQRMNPSIASYLEELKHANLAGAVVDAFGRQRISAPLTIFDNKQLFDNQPLFWDDQETSGTGTGSTHDPNEASTVLSVGAGTAGTRTRQTFQCFNYQPGKSQSVVMTGVLGSGESGITADLGLTDGTDGFTFEVIDGIASVNRRTSTSGSPVDNRTLQADWNVDKMNGSGDSKVTLDFDKTQIFVIDFQWLGVGIIRYGFNVDGVLIYCHYDLNANELTLPHVRKPNLPVRYQISNDGTGGASTMRHICVAVYSEGGRDDVGIVQYESTTSNRADTKAHVDANVADTAYAVVGIKLKAAYIGTEVHLESLTMLEEASADFEWLVLFNPTVAGTFTYADKANSALQTALGATANTITSLGTVIDGGYAQATAAGGGGGAFTGPLKTALRLGASIAGVVDQVVLAVRPLSASADIHGGLTWRELS